MPSTNLDELIKKAIEISGGHEPDPDYEIEEIGAIKSAVNEFIEKVPKSRDLANETLAFCEILKRKLKELEKTILGEIADGESNKRSTVAKILADMLSCPDTELRSRLDDWLYEMNKGGSVNEGMRIRLMVAQRGQKLISYTYKDEIRIILEGPDATMRHSLENLLDFEP